MTDYSAALEALEGNDADGLIAAFRGGKPGAVNAQVSNGKYGGSRMPSGNSIRYAEGDTMLHLAMRNRKWNIRKACVADLAADPNIHNSEDMTPPSMQIASSRPTFLLAVTIVTVLYLDLFGLSEAAFGPVGFTAACVFLLFSAFDMLLAVRWVTLARMAALQRGKAPKNAEKAAAKEEKVRKRANAKR